MRLMPMALCFRCIMDAPLDGRRNTDQQFTVLIGMQCPPAHQQMWFILGRLHHRCAIVNTIMIEKNRRHTMPLRGQGLGKAQRRMRRLSTVGRPVNHQRIVQGILTAMGTRGLSP